MHSVIKPKEVMVYDKKNSNNLDALLDFAKKKVREGGKHKEAWQRLLKRHGGAE